MLGSIKNHMEIYSARKKWRKFNAHNSTFMGEYFNSSIVQVGKESYGLLNVISHNERSKLYIGNYCSIAPNVTFVLSGEHDLSHISTFPFKTHCLQNIQYEATSNGNIIVDDDVWIGTGAIIMSGVRIKQGAVVAAGAVVTKNIDPYDVVGGVPAKHIKRRFNEALIQELLKVDFSKLTNELIKEHIDELYQNLDTVKQLEWMPKKER